MMKLFKGIVRGLVRRIREVDVVYRSIFIALVIGLFFFPLVRVFISILISLFG